MLKRILLLTIFALACTMAYSQGNGPTGTIPQGTYTALPTGASSTSTPASIGTVGPYNNVQSSTFNPNGTVGKGGCATDISTNATSTVTSAAQLAAGTYSGYTPPAMGDIAWVVNTNGSAGPCNMTTVSVGQPVTSTLRIPATASTVTTITGVNLPAGTVTLSGSTATTGSGDVLFWAAGGDPGDYTAIAAACTAIPKSGGTVYAPRGFYMLGTNAGNNPACNIPTTVVGSFAMLGDGEDGTLFYTAPWYNHSFNFGSVFAFTAAAPSYSSGWTLDGQGYALAYGPDTPFDTRDPQEDHITVRNFNLTSGSTESHYVSGGGGIGMHDFINNSTFVPSGTNMQGLTLSGSYNIQLNNDTAANSNPGVGSLDLTSNAGAANVSINGGRYILWGAVAAGAAIYLPDSGTPGASVISISGGTSICPGTSTSVGIKMARTGWILNVDSAFINSGSTCPAASGNTGGITNTSGATVAVGKSVITAIGTGNTVNNPSGGTYMDAGGNTYSGGAGMTGTGTTLLNPQSVGLSTPVVTGTGACATIGSQLPAATGVANSGTFACTGTTGAATLTLTWAANALNKWQCSLPRDVTTGADLFTFTSSSVTTCVFGAAAIVQNDVITWGPMSQY